MDERAFLRAYLDAFDWLGGWFSFDAALLFMAYHQLLAADGDAGDVLEIGVHHGLSAIAVAALRGAGRRLIAVDLFEELQAHNGSHSGGGSRSVFLTHMRRFFGTTDFIEVLACDSATLCPADLGDALSFCHVDGGHSPQETERDLALCQASLRPGGLLALDDYFNPGFPGVSEGALRYRLAHPGALRPLAVGFNKVLFQKLPAPDDLNDRFAAAFPALPTSRAMLWETPVRLLRAGMRPFIDLDRSTPRRLVPDQGLRLGACLAPQRARLEARPGQVVRVPVAVTNTSTVAFTAGEAPFGLSYHLRSGDGELLQFDHGRRYFTDPLAPTAERVVTLTVVAPAAPGAYWLELDIVWEGTCWFKDQGNATATIALVVTA